MNTSIGPVPSVAGARSPSTPGAVSYFWLTLSTTAVAYLGFSFTYFGPSLAGEYPAVSPMVHLHGWAFFLWYLLLPVQAGLVRAGRRGLHRALGYGSLALAALMTFTGLVVIGVQMDLARQPQGSPFWAFLGPPIFVTLLLFVVFYALALRFRRRPDFHKRFVLLASTGALGAAAFRILAQVVGFGLAAGVGGILLPNLIIVGAVLVERRAGRGVHPVYRWGLPLSLLVEVGTIVLMPTVIGDVSSAFLAQVGVWLRPLY